MDGRRGKPNSSKPSLGARRPPWGTLECSSTMIRYAYLLYMSLSLLYMMQQSWRECDMYVLSHLGFVWWFNKLFYWARKLNDRTTCPPWTLFDLSILVFLVVDSVLLAVTVGTARVFLCIHLQRNLFLWQPVGVCWLCRWFNWCFWCRQFTTSLSPCGFCSHSPWN